MVGFIITLLIGTFIAVYFLRQQQTVIQQAAASTSFSFNPFSTQSSPIITKVGDIVTLDVMVDPGVNLVSAVTMEIAYDSTRLEPVPNAFAPDTSIFSKILIGPTYSLGRIYISMGIDSPNKVIRTKSKVGTLTFKAIKATNVGVPTPVNYTGDNAAASRATTDQPLENVFSVGIPTYIAIDPVVPSPTPSRTPTPSLTPTATPFPETKMNLNLFLHGIGKAGDSLSPGVQGGGNMDPFHAYRLVRVDLYNDQNLKLISIQVPVNFDYTTGSFKGVAGFNALRSGDYLVNVKFTQSLDTQIGGIQTITSQGTHNLPQQSFITGDINNDGAISLNVLDFNTLINCIKGIGCSTEQRIQSDLDDNNKVDIFDFNLFIREITNLSPV